jgi:membrane protease YdiL (CAAX protease family)
MHEETRFIDVDFDRLKETNWPVIALAVIVDVAFLFVAMQVLLPHFPIERLTNGLIQATLVFSLARFALVALGVAMLIGGLRAWDVGLAWDKLLSGALVVFGLWIAMQLIGALLGLVTSGQVALSPIWTLERLPLIAGELIAQFLGNAFAEEVIFRGFLVTQVYLMLKANISGRGWRVTAALLISQLIFSLSHIPQRLTGNYTPLSLLLNLLVVWVYGILFGVLYLRTENIFIAVGVHALANAPVTVVALPSQSVGGLLALALGLVLIAAWRPLTRWMDLLGLRQQSPETFRQLMRSES